MIDRISFMGELSLKNPLRMFNSVWLVCILVVSVIDGASNCTTPFDCALYGECINGACICETGWKGPHCTTLDLLPTPLNSGFNYTINTWGGSPIQIKDKYYMLATLLGEGTPLYIWCTQGTVALAQSSTPQGPYEYIESIINSTTVNCTGVINPVIIPMANNEGYLLYYTCAQCFNDTDNSQKCSDPNYCINSLRVSYTNNTDLSDIPSWVHQEYPIFMPNASNGSWEGGIADNPGPVIINNNNSILLAYRGAHDTGVGLVIATKWDQNPYIRVNDGNVLFPGVSGLEDPFIWKSSMGYHMLLHSINGPSATDLGTIAWSLDGYNWNLNAIGEGAYGPTFSYVDGANFTCGRREEPKLLFDVDKNVPISLANVCYYGNDQIFVSMVPIKT